jgi:hypothetical protein
MTVDDLIRELSELAPIDRGLTIEEVDMVCVYNSKHGRVCELRAADGSPLMPL